MWCQPVMQQPVNQQCNDLIFNTADKFKTSTQRQEGLYLTLLPRENNYITVRVICSGKTEVKCRESCRKKSFVNKAVTGLKVR